MQPMVPDSTVSLPPCNERSRWCFVLNHVTSSVWELDTNQKSASDFRFDRSDPIPERLSEEFLNLVRRFAIILFAAPAFAQYAGPAILSRGQAPAAMDTP